MLSKIIIIVILILIINYKKIFDYLENFYISYNLKYNYIDQKWLHDNFFLFNVKNININNQSKKSVNINKYEKNQYKIIKLDKQNEVKEIFNSNNVQFNLDTLLIKMLEHVNLDGSCISLDDCVIVDILKAKGSYFPSLHTDIEWGVFDKSDGFQIWYLYENELDYGNMFILDTPEVIPASNIIFNKDEIKIVEQCSKKIIKYLDKSIYSHNMQYLDMKKGECLIFGKSLYHMSDFKNQPNRRCLNFRVVIKDKDGGIPINLKNICMYNSLINMRLRKYIKNDKIYCERHDIINFYNI